MNRTLMTTRAVGMFVGILTGVLSKAQSANPECTKICRVTPSKLAVGAAVWLASRRSRGCDELRKLGSGDINVTVPA